MWQPSIQSIEASHLYNFFNTIPNCKDALSKNDYYKLHQWSCDNSTEFWKLWLEQSGCIYNGSLDPVANDKDVDGIFLKDWFPNVTLNYAENLLCKVVDLDEAIVGLDESGRRYALSGTDLINQVQQLQKKFRELGIVANDIVAGFVPNCPESIIAMLATSSLGAVWTSCSPDFGIQGVLDRFSQVQPKILFTANGYSYNGKTHSLSEKNKAVIDSLDSLKKVIEIDFLRDDDRGFFPAQDSSEINWPEFTQVSFSHPLYVMYSSGTTGVPKCMVHSVGGTLIQHLKEHKLHVDLKAQEKIFYFTTCGWMMWNWLVSALSCSATVYVYEGSPLFPKNDSLWSLLEREKITVFGTSPKYLGFMRANEIKINDNHNLVNLRAVLSTGSPLLPEDFDYFYHSISTKENPIQLSSISGGTDIVSCFMLGNPMSPVRRGEIQGAGLAMDIAALDADGNAVIGQEGELVCRKSFPSMPTKFWDDPDFKRYKNSYFSTYPNTWTHGDFVSISSEGGVMVHGRSDSTLNPGGVRIGTAELYRQVECMPEIQDSLAVGKMNEGDEEIVLFVQLKAKLQLTDELRQLIRKKIRANTTPRHVPQHILQVSNIPYTISGKKVEKAVKLILKGENPSNKDALVNPECLEEYISLAKQF